MKTKSIVSLASICLIAGSFVAGNVVAAAYAPMITTALCGTGVNFDSEEFQQATAMSDALCQEIAEEGIVLMKNQNNTLPLKYEQGQEKNINVFGWASSDNGFLLSGIGSGSSTISEAKKVTLLKALEDGGFTVNDDLVNFYRNYDSKEDVLDSIITDKITEYAKELASDPESPLDVIFRFCEKNKDD